MSFLYKYQQNDLYYNINVVNKADTPMVLNYTDSRSNNLLDNVDNYDLSILSFSIDNSEIPLMIFPNDTFDNFAEGNFGTINNNYYTITIENTGTNTISQQGVQYLSKGHRSPYIYNFVDFCEMLNNAIKDGMTGAGIGGADRPFFFYDKDSASINLALPAIFNVNAINRMYVNDKLYFLFCRDIPGTYTDGSNGRFYRFSTSTNNNNYTCTEVKYEVTGLHTNAWSNGLLLKPYYPNLGNLIACKSIVFKTSQIPVMNEYVTNNLDLDNNTSNSYSKIMKSFDLSLGGADAILSRGIQNFVIPSEFQMTNLRSGGEALNNIDLQTFWRDKHGRLHPLFFAPSSTFTMKMLFRHK